MAPAFERAAHLARGGPKHCVKLRVARLRKRPPRRELDRPQRLGLPFVADPGDEPLVEQRVADGAALVVPAEVLHHAADVRLGGEHVRAESSDGARVQLEHGAVPLDAFVARAAQDQPGTAAARRAPRDERPAAGHPQVATQDDAALEGEQQVLADRLDGEQAPAVEALGDLPDLGTWVGSLDFDPFADERLQAARSPVKCIAFRHRVAR